MLVLVLLRQFHSLSLPGHKEHLLLAEALNLGQFYSGRHLLQERQQVSSTRLWWTLGWLSIGKKDLINIFHGKESNAKAAK